MSEFTMPTERYFDWALKPASSTLFDIHERPNGQFCVVLNHSLLRGVTSEMIHWWFLHFPNLRVTLDDVPGYESQAVAGYLLWHPSDHCSAKLSGRLGPNGQSRAGASIQIQEAMQYKTYGLKYPVNTSLKIFYCGPDGWAMGKALPFFGKVMCLRIHFKDVIEAGEIIGVHYHYEVVIGTSGNSPIARALNSKITSDYSPEFFAAWQLHNTIEVGTFENFLPVLFAQRGDLSSLYYARSMNPMIGVGDHQSAQSPSLFDKRLAGYKSTKDPFAYQGAEQASFVGAI
ncbi:MAG: hypothetical protein AAFY84_11190 [Pseudomonadota bacterium]